MAKFEKLSSGLIVPRGINRRRLVALGSAFATMVSPAKAVLNLNQLNGFGAGSEAGAPVGNEFERDADLPSKYGLAGTRVLVPGDVSVSYLATKTDSDSGGETTLTPSAQSITNAYSGRLLILAPVVYWFNASGGSISSINAGADAAAKKVGSTATNDQASAEIWTVLKPEGNTTGVFEVNASAAMLAVNIGVWLALGVTNLTPATAAQKTNSGASRSVSLTIPAGGLAVCASVIWGSLSNPSCTWSNASEAAEFGSDTTKYKGSWAHKVTATTLGSYTITPTWTATAAIETVAAAWS